ncbi:hypothetical protein F2Q69_00061793 [Brassica cretica]|uniref:Uncharacterized protein n=1 Tax=Brassica cretica TaxID=69181 RepID=A0A8S9RP73_BRACR|nr:hypothetical protein F2Q69_00061793 [Brassica cretica]
MISADPSDSAAAGEGIGGDRNGLLQEKSDMGKKNQEKVAPKAASRVEVAQEKKVMRKYKGYRRKETRKEVEPTEKNVRKKGNEAEEVMTGKEKEPTENRSDVVRVFSTETEIEVGRNENQVVKAIETETEMEAGVNRGDAEKVTQTETETIVEGNKHTIEEIITTETEGSAGSTKRAERVPEVELEEGEVVKEWEEVSPGKASKNLDKTPEYEQ